MHVNYNWVLGPLVIYVGWGTDFEGGGSAHRRDVRCVNVIRMLRSRAALCFVTFSSRKVQCDIQCIHGPGPSVTDVSLDSSDSRLTRHV